MADPVEPILPVSPLRAEEPVAPAPAVDAPVVETPVVDAAAPATPELKVEPGLLEKFDETRAAEDAASAEKAKTEPPAEEPKKDLEAKTEEKPVEEKVSELEAPVPIEWKFELPETLKADDAKMAEFTGILEGLLKPKEGETPSQYGQKLIDLHNSAMQSYAEQTRTNQFKVFNETKANWEKQVIADPEIGGSGHETAIAAAARVRDRIVTSERPGTRGFSQAKYDSDQREFREFLAATGAGSHPAFIRMLHNAARFIDEPQADSLPSNIRPPKDIGKPPGDFKSVMYDNPRSQQNGR